MAFDSTKLLRVANLLSLIASTDNTPGFFVYNDTAETSAVVSAAHYFDGAAGFMGEGSVILAICSDGTKHFSVSAVSAAGVVTFADPGHGLSDLTSGLSVVQGQATTVAAVDTIASGLSLVSTVVCSEDSDPVDNPQWFTASKGDQAGAPVAGSFYLKSWQNTSGSDPTPVAATVFGKKVNWIAIGTK